MKLFNTNNIDIVRNCQKEFAFELPSVGLSYIIGLIKMFASPSQRTFFNSKPYKACNNSSCESM